MGSETVGPIEEGGGGVEAAMGCELEMGLGWHGD